MPSGFFLRFRFGDRKEILRDRLEEFERPLEEFERPFWSLKTPKKNTVCLMKVYFDHLQNGKFF